MPITTVPASRAHSTQLVEEAQRLEDVFVRTIPAPALSEEEIAFDESLKEGEYLVAARKAREDVFADPRSPEAAKRARPYATPKTLLPESAVVTAPLQSQTDNEQLEEKTSWRIEAGKWANQRLEEGVTFARLVRGGKKPETLRDQFPEFFGEVVDKLREPVRRELFEHAERSGMTSPQLLDYIAEPKCLSGSTLNDYRKEYRSHASIGRRRRPHSSPK
jgi:phage terminase Nu1 subunit (DNA packaging protein)